MTPDTPIATAVGLMRDKAIRRLPVIEDGKPVGIVSLGDLAERQDPRVGARRHQLRTAEQLTARLAARSEPGRSTAESCRWTALVLSS